MPLTTLALVAELPEFADLTWPQIEAWAVAMREDLPGVAIAAALEDLQARLIDEVCGPKWLPVRDRPAPFGCPGCGVMSDFARKGARRRHTPEQALRDYDRFRASIGEHTAATAPARSRE